MVGVEQVGGGGGRSGGEGGRGEGGGDGSGQGGEGKGEGWVLGAGFGSGSGFWRSGSGRYLSSSNARCALTTSASRPKSCTAARQFSAWTRSRARSTLIPTACSSTGEISLTSTACSAAPSAPPAPSVAPSARRARASASSLRSPEEDGRLPKDEGGLVASLSPGAAAWLAAAAALYGVVVGA